METFAQTSDAPYDQCYYVLHLEGGGKTIWDDYEDLRNYWMLNGGWGMSHVEVEIKRDSSQSGTTRGRKGFG